MQVTFDGGTLRFIATEEGDQAVLRTLEARAELLFLVSRVEKDRDVDSTREWTIEEIKMHPIPTPTKSRK